MRTRRRINRTIVTGIVILLYLLLFNAYIYMLGNSMLSPKQYKLMYNFITASMVVFTFLDRVKITRLPYHSQFNWVAFNSLFCNYLLIIAIHAQIISNPVVELIAFNGLIFVVTLLILWAGGKHGYFKHRYEDD